MILITMAGMCPLSEDIEKNTGQDNWGEKGVKLVQSESGSCSRQKRRPILSGLHS